MAKHPDREFREILFVLLLVLGAVGIIRCGVDFAKAHRHPPLGPEPVETN